MSKVTQFQDKLISMGWLDRDTLVVLGTYGTLDDVTYEAIWNVQQYANDPAMKSVRDAGGFYRKNNGTGDYYEIDEATYNYIMNSLPNKP